MHAGRKIGSWTMTEYGKVKNANTDVPVEAIQTFSQLYNLKVGSSYARHHQLMPMTFEEAIEHFGYDALGKVRVHAPTLPTKRYRDWKRLAGKWMYDSARGDASPRHFRSYMTPLEPVGNWAG